MAPTLVFDPAAGQPGSKGPLYAVLGSPGGSVIIQFVVKTLVGMMDWGLDPQQAVSAVDFGAANTPKTNVGGEHPAIDTSDNGDHDPLVVGLRKLGHQVDLADQSQRPVRDRAGQRGPGRWRRPAPRGAGHGRHPVTAPTARVARLTESDWRVFAVVRLRALTDSLGENDPQYRQEAAFTAAQWRRRLRDHAQFAALIGDRPVGLIGAQQENPESVYLYSLWLDPAARGQGLARPLVAAAVDWARDRRVAHRHAAGGRRQRRRPVVSTRAWDSPRQRSRKSRRREMKSR